MRKVFFEKIPLSWARLKSQGCFPGPTSLLNGLSQSSLVSEMREHGPKSCPHHSVVR